MRIVEAVEKLKIRACLLKEWSVAKWLDGNGHSRKTASEPLQKAFCAVVEFEEHSGTYIALCGFWWDSIRKHSFSTGSLGVLWAIEL